MMTLKDRVSKLIQSLCIGLYEREEVISLTILTAMAGESMFLLGRPGIAKSMVAHRAKYIFQDASTFEYLMNRFSTPDEIFGPVSISKLKCDNYERVVDGYLPTADVVFLDEIWKSSSAIQNTLLMALNERKVRNGREVVNLPLKFFIAASNELPAMDDGGEALWDRFIVRYEVQNICDKKLFCKMISEPLPADVGVCRELQISEQDYTQIRENVGCILIPQTILLAILKIKESNPIISDRRWQKIVKLLRASALLNGRREVAFSDLVIISHCLWSDNLQRQDTFDTLNRLIIELYISQYAPHLATLSEEVVDLNQRHKQVGSFAIFDKRYYTIRGYESETTIIDAEFYKSLNNRSKRAYLERYNNTFTLNICPDNGASISYSAHRIEIAKAERGVIIDGKHYELEGSSRSTRSEIRTRAERLIIEIQELKQRINGELRANIFVFNSGRVVASLDRELLRLRRIFKGIGDE